MNIIAYLSLGNRGGGSRDGGRGGGSFGRDGGGNILIILKL